MKKFVLKLYKRRYFLWLILYECFSDAESFKLVVQFEHCNAQNVQGFESVFQIQYIQH